MLAQKKKGANSGWMDKVWFALKDLALVKNTNDDDDYDLFILYVCI